MGEDVSASKHAALYYYCSNYHTGQQSWQYEVLSKSKYKPGRSEKDILDTEDFAAVQYYHHLLRIFETNNVCDIDLVADEVGPDGVTDFWNQTHHITVSVNGTWDSAAEFARDILEQIDSCDWGYQVDLVDVFSSLGSFNYPLSIEVYDDTDEDEGEVESLWLGFNWWNEPEEPEDSCNGCIYFNGSDSLLRCAVNPLSNGRCIEYQTTT